MSKGWESKNVEEQQAAAEVQGRVAPEDNSAAKAAEAERKRKIQALEMQREFVLSQRTSSPHRRSALELALATIERELEVLGMAIKL
jgi:hypothetical protein